MKSRRIDATVIVSEARIIINPPLTEKERAPVKVMEQIQKTTPRINIMTHVLDDDNEVLKAMEMAFDQHGIKNYKTYTDYEMFLNGIDQEIHIAVIDYYLNYELTGLDVLKMLIQKNPKCYVIMVSGQYDIDVVVEALNLGCNAYVRKKDNYIGEVIKYVNKGIYKISRDMEYYQALIAQAKKLF